jgi:ABC-type branched-subunit amino acid transport system ATPase component
VLLIEHDVELVRQVCDSLVVLDFGKVIARGEPDDVLSNPRVIDAYLGAEVPSTSTDGATKPVEEMT